VSHPATERQPSEEATVFSSLNILSAAFPEKHNQLSLASLWHEQLYPAGHAACLIAVLAFLMHSHHP